MSREMRRFKQEISRNECLEILKTERRGVLSVIGDDGYPYSVPMNFYYDEKEEKLYFHCAREGHKIDAIKSCNKVCFTVWNSGYKKEGDWAYYVTSVIAMGRAELISDSDVIDDKLRKLALKYFPTAEEIEKVMASSASKVQMIVLNIEHLTGKLVHEK